MSIRNIVQITITRDTRAVSQVGFGTPLLVGQHQAWVGSTDIIRSYSHSDDLLDDGFVSTDALYKAAAKCCGQNPRVTQFKIGRVRSNACKVSVVQVAVEKYTVVINRKGDSGGMPFSYTSGPGDTAEVIATGLMNAINSGYNVTGVSVANKTFTVAADLSDMIAGDIFVVSGSTGNNGAYTVASVSGSGPTVITVSETVASAVADGKLEQAVTAGTVDTDHFHITADTTNAAFSVTVIDEGYGNDLTVEWENVETTATALAAMREVDDDWYGLMTVTARPQATQALRKTETLAVAAWAETQRKIYSASSGDQNIKSYTYAADGALGTPSIRYALIAAAYERTNLMYHSNIGESDDTYPDAAWLGKMLPYTPGGATWAYKTLAGVDVDTFTQTQEVNIVGTPSSPSSCNLYMEIGGLNVTRDGHMASGEWIDVIIGVDWIEARLVERLWSVLANVAKIPFTDAGIATVEAAIRAVLAEAINRKILASLDSLTIPVAADVSDNDKANRILPDITWQATLAGAIHAVQVSGRVSL